MAEILEKELSFQITGIFFEISKKYGPGLKEIIYEKALAEALKEQGIPFEEQKRINIYSIDTGKVLGTYVPDFVIGGKIIVEIKATPMDIRQHVEQQNSYLRASEYEICYLVNFGIRPATVKRLIFTNDRKHEHTRTTTNGHTNEKHEL